MAESLDIARAGLLAGVPHGFLGRSGGVSGGAVASLNCGLGAGDDPAAVAENRRRAGEAVLPGARMVGVYQVHSPDCVTVAEPWDDDSRPQADALVTDRAGLVLAIVTADCAPVLLADLQARVIGAAHAGWKGAIGGVCEATVAAMETLGAQRSRIVAAIGPCIAQPSYEVDEAFRARFMAEDPASDRFFKAGRAGHCQFDLEGMVAARLAGCGVGRVEAMGLDTCAQPARYYSYRRATLAGEPAYGRQISLIGLPRMPG
ncbi:MAG TPA: peptidoglycan editing factor PgeF [Novosphingobium sp.]|nr:peptidoglycan editing factor PgeF [Novosphingobium sp.]